MRLRNILIFILLLSCVTLVRETGLYEFNYFWATTKHNLNTSWRSNSITATLEKSIFHTEFPNNKYSELPIVVLYKEDTLLTSSGQGPSVILTIDNITVGPLWTPLYKRANYVANVSCSFDTNLTKINGTNISSINPNITLASKANGKTTILGLSSYRNSMNIIQQLIASDALKDAKKYLSSLD